MSKGSISKKKIPTSGKGIRKKRKEEEEGKHWTCRCRLVDYVKEIKI
jgi:hypothetical protein